MNSTPLFSVVIPVYNYGQFVGKAIESVLNQSMQDFELIIVNDASTDNSHDVIQTYLGDKRITYLQNETNSGCYTSLKRGFAKALGTYAASLSADDYYLPDAFEKLAAKAHSHPDADIIYGKYCFVDSNGTVTQWVNHPGWDKTIRTERHHDLGDLLRYDLYINITAAFVKLSLFNTYEFDQTLRVSDYDFILQLARDDKKFIFIDEYLLAFRHHGEQLSVGDNFFINGTQFKDQLTLLERYVTPQNKPKLAGAARGILRLLDSKQQILSRYPESAAKILPELIPRIAAIKKTLTDLDRSVTTKALRTTPAVSVIVPTFNRPALLAGALESIAGQTLQNFEIVVINDGGCDVADVIRASRVASRINYISLGQNFERSFVRNCGLKIAQGTYIAYLDDDDIFYPDHLQTLFDALTKGSHRAAYTDAFRAVQTLENGVYTTIQKEVLFSQEFSLPSLFVHNQFPNLCVMHERSLISEIGYLDESLNTHEDWDYWIRIGIKYPFVHIKKVTAEYRHRKDATNTTFYNHADFNRTREIIYNRYRQFTLGNPEIIAAQNAFLDNIKVADVASESAFVTTLVSFSHDNNIEEMISFYNTYRKKFPDSPDLARVDELINRLKKHHQANSPAPCT